MSLKNYYLVLAPPELDNLVRPCNLEGRCEGGARGVGVLGGSSGGLVVLGGSSGGGVEGRTFFTNENL